eukprot:gnl/Spiro4/24934_TR12395_c0_g9_i1.p1 gnl/Spiro4/24934_TR12395_c0_g9~~gnl/Spiro4/24934_TR12395_c0_g9_i1.p1  ORF type:complete len:234 (-),score=63.87 gnl/Spiro4/24934_TR12395_c0_g9_i1:147-821(-)
MAAPMRLYTHPLLAAGRAIHFFAALIKIPLEVKIVDIFKEEHKEAAYLAINPSGLLPVLDDNGFIVTETPAITIYLAEKFGSAAYYPARIKTKALLFQYQHWEQNHLHKHTEELTAQLLNTFFGRASDEDIKTRARAHIANALGLIEQWLSARAFLVTDDAPSLADLTCLGYIDNLHQILGVSIQSCPGILRWLSVFHAMPEYLSTHSLFDQLKSDWVSKISHR